MATSDEDIALLDLRMICLTCAISARPSRQAEIAILPNDVPMANEHRGHLIIGTHVFRWPEENNGNG
jgi:hypothetical protein